MKFKPRKLNIALILFYMACMIFTAITLFRLQDDLVYGNQALSIAEITAAQPVIIKLNLVVGFTLLVGMAILVFMYNNKNENIIYVEKKEQKREEKETDDKESDEDHKLSAAFINDLIKSEKDEQKILDKALTGICKKVEAGVGVIYTVKKDKSKRLLEMKSTYALSLGESQTLSYEMGEGLVGQVGKELKPLVIDDIPEGYIKVVSGLGSASPTHLFVMPIEHDKNLFGVLEIASFTSFDKSQQSFIKSSMARIMERLHVKKAATATKKKETTKEKKPAKGKTKKA